MPQGRRRARGLRGRPDRPPAEKPCPWEEDGELPGGLPSPGPSCSVCHIQGLKKVGVAPEGGEVRKLVLEIAVTQF